MIYIVGIGPGHKDYILPKAVKVMKKCDLIIGFKRAVDSLDFLDVPKKYMTRLTDLDEYILDLNSEQIISDGNFINCQKQINNVAVIASGDPTFYGITNYIKKRCEKDFEVISGISSFQYLTSKVKMPWNDSYLGSLHGRKQDFIDNVKKNKLSIWLTDKEKNPAVLCKALYEENINCRVIIGENLSYDDEVISEGKPYEFIDRQFKSLNVFIVYRI